MAVVESETKIRVDGGTPSLGQIPSLLAGVAKRYPGVRAAHQLAALPRMAFYLELASEGIDVQRSRICDIGGGICMFAPGCAAFGFAETVLVDDFQDTINHKLGESIFKAHKELGVKIITSDVVKDGIAQVEGEFDVITLFDCIEHFHHTPRRLLRQAVDRLRPGGKLIVAAPNCANIRKRLAAIVGRTSWSSMDEWYLQEVFRDHVREPNVQDLLYIGKDLGLERMRIHGRNFMGYETEKPLVKALTPIFDRVLRLRPSLCSNLYLVGYKVNLQ